MIDTGTVLGAPIILSGVSLRHRCLLSHTQHPALILFTLPDLAKSKCCHLWLGGAKGSCGDHTTAFLPLPSSRQLYTESALHRSPISKRLLENQSKPGRGFKKHAMSDEFECKAEKLALGIINETGGSREKMQAHASIP